MTGRWHACGCGCGLSHKVIDGRIICPHPNFMDLLGPGELFPINPGLICPPCSLELEQVLEAASNLARRRLEATKSDAIAAMGAGVEALAETIVVERETATEAQQVNVMLSEGGAVWEHES